MEKMEKKKIRVEFKIGDDPENPELYVTGQADEEMVDQAFKFLGLRYAPPSAQVETVTPRHVVCTQKEDCLDSYTDKCQECASNTAKSYFTPKEKGP